ncbi:SOS response-associated peptidase [Roseomonas sp. OT10]|uniref:SOS response-associated peptidase n=1 Tax=Roseomonas cutis TaxID=2897332 RepID=UPI001E584741|nr:SOS response-associated peptidase [Roseomonas sp. OT10]UFN48670.1 SOS response-associated peptidase [Roseomonas sp. OT10]
MCGRYFLVDDPAGLRTFYGCDHDTPNHPASWNVAPTQDSLVVRRHPETGARHLGLLRWGLVPRWAKDDSGGARLMNARADGVADKPSFRDAFARRRCLVPASGFYEWRQEGAGPKQPYAIALRSGEPMTLAGLWEGWKRPDGTWLRTYTIVTTDANALMQPLHHRMPVILPRDAWAAWLGEEEAGRDALLDLLRPFPQEALRIWPVDKRVNRFSENDAELLRRAEAADPPAGLDDPPEACRRPG